MGRADGRVAADSAAGYCHLHAWPKVHGRGTDCGLRQGMKRLNKCVELLAQGQPIYYTSVEERGYEGGRAAARTWADYIAYEMEHGPYGVTRLLEFMRSLVDGGPTASGHRTPAVIVTPPLAGSDEPAFR